MTLKSPKWPEHLSVRVRQDWFSDSELGAEAEMKDRRKRREGEGQNPISRESMVLNGWVGVRHLEE